MRATLRALVLATPLGRPLRGLARQWRAWRRGEPDYDGETFAVMRRTLRRTDTCVDVGAHDGTVLQEMIRYAPHGRHFAFEPLPHLGTLLRERFPTVAVHQVALSNEPGSTTFRYLLNAPGQSSLRPRRNERGKEVTELTVQLARMDDIIPAHQSVRFIKIDVEGAELGVLQGGLETIRRSKPYIVFEHGLGAADYFNTTPAMVFDLLTDCGLQITLMSRWLANGKPFGRAAFDDQFYAHRNYYFLAYPT